MATPDELVGPLQRAVSCVTSSVLRTRLAGSHDAPRVVTFGLRDAPTTLGQDRAIALEVRHFYRLLPPEGRRRARSQALTVGYIYEFLDPDGARLIGYHWHPIEGGSIDHPHLHIGRQLAHSGLPAAVRTRTALLVRSHLPTGPVLLPRLLMLAIREFGIEPRRDDWREVLTESEAAIQTSLSSRLTDG